MLFYKVWLETRSRFVIALAGCTFMLSLMEIEVGRTRTPSPASMLSTLRGLTVVNMFLAFAWTLAVILLMMGGLLHEKATGSSAFTLALPVSRLRLMLVRVAVGAGEAALLAILPWIGLLCFTGMGFRAPLISQAVFHVLFLLCGGVLFFAIALFVSSVVESQYTSPAITIAACSLVVYGLKGQKFAPFNPWAFMVGSRYFSWRTGVLNPTGSLSYAIIFFVASALLILLSIKAIQRRDF
jgi:ABC-type transport system involved in multi-copper enzyme maturation permease subunit